MGRQRSFPEGTEGEMVQMVRKGTCPVCKIWGKTEPTLPVFVDPFDRKPDGSLYTMQELMKAAEDFRDRWNRGPFLHYQCALEKSDLMAGFDIETGEYVNVGSVVSLQAAEG